MDGRTHIHKERYRFVRALALFHSIYPNPPPSSALSWHIYSTPPICVHTFFTMNYVLVQTQLVCFLCVFFPSRWPHGIGFVTIRKQLGLKDPTRRKDEKRLSFAFPDSFSRVLTNLLLIYCPNRVRAMYDINTSDLRLFADGHNKRMVSDPTMVETAASWKTHPQFSYTEFPC